MHGVSHGKQVSLQCPVPQWLYILCKVNEVTTTAGSQVFYLVQLATIVKKMQSWQNILANNLHMQSTLPNENQAHPPRNIDFLEEPLHCQSLELLAPKLSFWAPTTRGEAIGYRNEKPKQN